MQQKLLINKRRRFLAVVKPQVQLNLLNLEKHSFKILLWLVGDRPIGLNLHHDQRHIIISSVVCPHELLHLLK